MSTDLLRSPSLRTGDLVRLVSPASFPDQAGIDHNRRVIESWGLRCDTGEHVLDQHGFMAGSDADRLNDLNAAFKDPEVRAIVATRGGAGAYRIADDIDFAAVRADPKPLVGFSDITSLHLSLIANSAAGGIHGCLFGSTAQSTARQSLMSTEPVVVNRDAGAVSAPVEFSGTAHGRLIGGNLQLVATSVGVHLPSLKGAILFLEYHRARLGAIDRYLTQLMGSGALDEVAGIALGSFEASRGKVDRGWGVLDVLNDRLGRLNVPVLGGLFAGHDLTDRDGEHDQCCVPLGSLAHMDVSHGTLTVESVMR